MRSQSVADPSAQAGHWHCGRAGMHGQRGLKMLDDIGVQMCAARHSSSATRASCGNSSLIISPDCPHGWNEKGEPSKKPPLYGLP